MQLPTNRNKPSTENPKLLILFGKPKSGKTSLLAQLENNLIIDLEEGTNYIEAMAIKARNITELREIAKAIKEAGCPYKYITLDTVTALEDMVLSVALDDYKNTTMGKTFTGTDVRTLSNGAGYLYIREAFIKVVNVFRGLTDHLILVGHTKDRMINKEGKELSENLLDLSGKLERIVASKADALGYVYRKKNQTIVNFNGGEDLIVEARPAHLRGKELIMAESNEEGIITAYWDKIFKQ